MNQAMFPAAALFDIGAEPNLPPKNFEMFRLTEPLYEILYNLSVTDTITRQGGQARRGRGQTWSCRGTSRRCLAACVAAAMRRGAGCLIRRGAPPASRSGSATASTAGLGPQRGRATVAGRPVAPLGASARPPPPPRCRPLGAISWVPSTKTRSQWPQRHKSLPAPALQFQALP